MEILRIEILNSCRLCMLSTSNLDGIFKTFEDEGRPISEIITEFSGIEIDANDSLSKKICTQCISSVAKVLEFKQLCIDSDETVRYNLLLADSQPDERNKDQDEMSHIEEYFIEDDESQNQVSEPLEYEELFIKDSIDQVDDDSTNDDSRQQEAPILIERVDTKSNNSVYFEVVDTNELTVAMKKAHYAKEQQKKHKCPHCEKAFKFPSKGLLNCVKIFTETYFL